MGAPTITGIAKAMLYVEAKERVKVNRREANNNLAAFENRFWHSPLDSRWYVPKAMCLLGSKSNDDDDNDDDAGNNINLSYKEVVVYSIRRRKV